MLHTVGFLRSKISPRKLLVLSLVLLPKIMAAQLLLGAEFMTAYRELEDGTDGRFNRLQFSAKYSFGYTDIVLNEKK